MTKMTALTAEDARRLVEDVLDAVDTTATAPFPPTTQLAIYLDGGAEPDDAACIALAEAILSVATAYVGRRL